MNLSRYPKSKIIEMFLKLDNDHNRLSESFLKLSEDFARKTGDLDLALTRQRTLEKANENLVNQRTQALTTAEAERNSNIALRKEADYQRTLREQAECHAADLRKMVDLLTLVAGRE